MENTNEIKLNLGCGNITPFGWINVDYSIGSRLSKIPIFSFIIKKLKLFRVNWNENIFVHNLTKKFPWGSQSVDNIYSSHTLEHLSKKEGRFFLQQCFRVLKNGGVARIIVPDLERTIKDYKSEKLKAEDFVNALGVLQKDNHNKLYSAFFSYPHKCMYDTKSLKRIMNEIGFITSSKNYLESEIKDIKEIEVKDRCIGSIVIEGKKPFV